MKIKVWALLFILTSLSTENLFASSVNFSGNPKKINTALETPLPVLVVGERLVYEVSWMGVPVGIGRLEVREKTRRAGHEVYHVVAIAQTNAFLSKIYAIHDEVHSFIDAGEFYSLEFSKDIKEGRYRANERILYDYRQKKGFHESFLNQQKKEFDIPEKAHDFLSAFYWFRVQPVTVGKSLEAVLNTKEKNWDLEFKVLRRQTLEIRGRGSVDTIVVEPKTRYQGVLYNRGRAWVYFSTDKKRIPVWVRLETPFGPVVGVLKSD